MLFRSTPARLAVAVAAFLACAGGPARGQAADSAMVRLLKGGKIPDERVGTVLDLIGKRGTPADLAYVFERAVQPDGFSPGVRARAFGVLGEAARNRKARPAGALEPLVGLLASPDVAPAIRVAALQLVGPWEVEAARPALEALAGGDDTPAAVRAAAFSALGELGGPVSAPALTALAAPGKPWPIRAQAVAALAASDLSAAAKLGVTVLGDAPERTDPGALLGAFLARKGGPEALAEAVTAGGLSVDTAKLALRSLYAAGRTDAPLVNALSAAANLSAETPPLTSDELAALIADVQAKGDPARGEAIFRRAELNCLKCHGVAGAGGQVGPDLSAVGGSSPVDYLVQAVWSPQQAIKEAYTALSVLTADGQVYQGIVVQKDDERLILRDANGAEITIAAADVEETKEGGSLMPQGLINFMTRSELVDLVRFLTELGKPGPYGPHAPPTIQRWRILTDVPQELLLNVPSADSFRALIQQADPARWQPLYARVDGTLPLDDRPEAAGKEGPFYLRGEVEVSVAGPLELAVDDPAGLRLWVDDQLQPEGAAPSLRLTPGRHVVTVRVDPAQRSAKGLRLAVGKPVGAATQYQVIGGR
jgi:putative heme-binding domain-containing protein